jgi:peptidoglycan/xylan/chitin deacetylase (PgdA/CDA1 family)
VKKCLRIFLIVTIISGIFLQGISLSSDYRLNIQFDGKPLVVSPAPVNVNGRVYVPLQPFFQKLGGSVSYDPSSGIFTVIYQGNYLKFDVSNGITNNIITGEKTSVRIPIYNNQYYIPIRAVMEFLDYRVGWLGEFSRVLVDSPIQHISVINYSMIVPKAEIQNYAGRSGVVSIENFEAQMKLLAEEGYKTLSIKDIQNFINGKNYYDKSVVITFDGGHISTYTHAYPILKKYRLKGTAFVETGSVGLSSSNVTWAQLKEMYDAGVLDVQSLTHTFYRFSDSYKILQARPQDIIKDLKISKQLIEALVENKVYALAYPYGIYNDAITTYAVEAGFKMAFSTKGENIKKSDNPMTLRRNNIQHWMDISYFKSILDKQ